ncbi:Transposase [Azospirillum endophyticum]
MYQIHPNARIIRPNARITPAVRAAIASSAEPSGVLAKRYGVSTETVRKWRHRGRGGLPGPFRPPQASAVAGFRGGARHRLRAAPDDPLCVGRSTFTLRHFLPHLNRDAVYRILKAEGLGACHRLHRPNR